MADETEDNPKVKDSPNQPTPFIELLCKPSGKTLRFAPGTKAGFALTFANNKLHQIQSKSKTHLPFSSHIESVKDGEDPIVFGPTATLLDFGHGWKLVAVADYEGVKEKKMVDKGLFGDSYTKKTGSNKEMSGAQNSHKKVWKQVGIRQTVQVGLTELIENDVKEVHVGESSSMVRETNLKGQEHKTHNLHIPADKCLISGEVPSLHSENSFHSLQMERKALSEGEIKNDASTEKVAGELEHAAKTPATDAALQNFKQKWELLRVCCDQAEEFVESLKQRIGSECLIDEATKPGGGGGGGGNGLPPISAVRLEQMSKAVRWLVIELQHGSGAHAHHSPAPFDARFNEDNT